MNALGVLAAAVGGGLGTIIAHIAIRRTPPEWRWTLVLGLTVAGSFVAGIGAFVANVDGRDNSAPLSMVEGFTSGLAALSSITLLAYMWWSTTPGNSPADDVVAPERPVRSGRWAVGASTVVAASAAAAIAGYLLFSVLYFTYTKFPQVS